MILKTVSRFHLSAFACSFFCRSYRCPAALRSGPSTYWGGWGGCQGAALLQPWRWPHVSWSRCLHGAVLSLPARPLCSDTWLLCYKKCSAGAMGLCSGANINTGATVCVFSVSSAFSSVCNKQGMCSKCMPASVFLQIPVQIGKPLLPYQYPMQSSLLPMTSGETDKRMCFPSYLPIFSCNHQ